MNESARIDEFSVHAIDAEGDGIISIELRPIAGTIVPAEPGSHVDLHLPNGLIRQYSLINRTHEPSYRVAVKRDAKSRGGSNFIHNSLRAGMRVSVSAPRNHFPVNVEAEHSVFLAGGIGITPIVTMAERLSAAGRAWTLVYAVRSRRELVFLDRLERAAGDVRVHVDEEAGGLLDVAATIASAPQTSHFYCCGPGPMLDAFLSATSGLPEAQVHFERFSAAPLTERRGTFTLELERSKTQLEVHDGETILSALRRIGLEAATSCEEGVCGTCETRVLAGIPEHRDSVLSKAERAANTSMMICCSGSLSPTLRLDL